MIYLKTPNFWKKITFLSIILTPFSLIYLGIFHLNNLFKKTHKISKPVICIGNLIAGGSGKTPVAMAIGKILQESSTQFAYLSRGYKGGNIEFLRVEEKSQEDSIKVGDEPLLLSKIAPTFVAKERIFGAKKICKMSEFKAIILDDGMQNNSLYKDFNIMVVDSKIGFGNNLLIPAGPKRETLSSGLKKCDLIVIIGEENKELLKKLPGKKIVNAKILPKNLDEFKNKKLMAFCGLAYPKKFFNLLEKNHLEITKTISFPDHHDYKVVELESLLQKAKKQNAKLITTKKDWIKFPKSFKNKISYLDIELEFENTELIKEELKRIL